jgi:hypothetical protein
MEKHQDYLILLIYRQYVVQYPVKKLLLILVIAVNGSYLKIQGSSQLPLVEREYG